jgi:hypothetical protein
LVHRLEEVGIANGSRHDQVDLSLKNGLQLLKQTERGWGMLARLEGQKVYQKVQIAPSGVEVIFCC